MKACVDIGGTKVAVSLAGDEPSTSTPPRLHQTPVGSRATAQADAAAPGITLLARQQAPTAKEGGNDAVAQQVIQLIDMACTKQGVSPDTITGVGVSSAGPFVLDDDGAVELASPNICGGLAGPARGLPNDWMSAVLEAPLRARFPKVRVENDAIAALEAERRWGALQGLDHCAYVTWSTGVGIGLCVDGRALRGKRGNAGHAGHTFVDNDDGDRAALCGCGNVGDVEGLVAGNAIARRFGLEAAQLFTAAKAGDKHAIDITEGLCRVMGRMLYNLVVTLDLERISLGGSVFWHNRDFLLPRLQAQINGKLPALTEGVRLVAAGLGDQLGDYAALALVD